MRTPQQVRVGMLNTCGIKYNAPEIEDWIEADRLNVTVITETRLIAAASTGLSLRHLHAAAPHSSYWRQSQGRELCGHIYITRHNGKNFHRNTR